MDLDLFKTTRDFAIEYGTVLGVIWLATFFTLMSGMTGGNILMMMLSMGLMGITLLMPLYLAWRYKQHLKSGDRVSMGMAWAFAILMFFYASVMTGAGEFVYFQYMDQGKFLDFFMNFLASPETEAQYKMIGATEFLEQSRMQLQELANLTPLDITLNLFVNNIFLSLLYSIPVAAVAHRKCHLVNPEKLYKIQNNQ
ncbi:MAG: DUF4199 domain-containing protein [Bacteroidaceae bacterium]|jgi:hypothetical protein|nr:DUF4199 domain-containing protein [Bacteroidaceae bacterium]